MKFSLVLFLLLLSNSVLANYCKNWEYSDLSVLITSIYKDKEVEKRPELERLQIYTTWNGSKRSGVWLDDTEITGSKKNSLKEFFGIREITPHYMVNSIGSKGWELIDVYQNLPEDNHDLRHYYFKRCKIIDTEIDK